MVEASELHGEFVLSSGKTSTVYFDKFRFLTRPDLLLMVGDAVQHGQRYEDWEQYFFAPAKGLLGTTPFYLCWGNHEERATWARDFVACPEPRSYYAFDYGDAHFLYLDANTTVSEMTVTSDSFRSRVEGVIYGATLTSITPINNDTYEVTLALDTGAVNDLRQLYLNQFAARRR